MELKANRRLKEAFSFWIKCATNYFEPEEFVVNLNACIQSLRNVTFVLQAQKGEITGFDKWYSGWQEAMRADPILRWCVDARNQIVKQDDLAKQSYILATFHEDYLVEFKAEVEVPIDAPLGLVAKLLLASLRGRRDCNGFLRIERQWKVDNLEGVELLAGLSHVFTVLSFLLTDTERQIGPSAIYPSFDSGHSPPNQAAIRQLLEELNPDFMNEFEDYRTSWFRLPGLERVTVREEGVSLPPETKEEAKERYKLAFPDLGRIVSLRDRVSACATMARRILETDGSHVNIIFLVGRGGSIEMATTEYQDQAHKYAFWTRMAKLVRRKGIQEIISIGEAWNYSAEALLAYGNADNIPIHKKKEALMIAGGRRPEEFQILYIPFTHTENRIVFAEENWSTEPPNFYLQIRTVWKSYKGFG